MQSPIHISQFTQDKDVEDVEDEVVFIGVDMDEMDIVVIAGVEELDTIVLGGIIDLNVKLEENHLSGASLLPSSSSSERGALVQAGPSARVVVVLAVVEVTLSSKEHPVCTC